jgi:hypothetical protein
MVLESERYQKKIRMTFKRDFFRMRIEPFSIKIKIEKAH